MMMKYSELRMKGIDRDVVLSKTSEIVHSIDESGEELQVYLLTDEQNSDVRIQVHQRLFVNYFIIDACQPCVTEPLKVSTCADGVILLESKPLKELILHMLKLKDSQDPEIQSHYVEIICRYLDAELAANGTLSGDSHNKQKTMDKLREFIDQNLKRNLSVKTLTDVCHMSERSLYYLFRESEATTPLSYIQQRKIARVHQEIRTRESSRNITQIAMEYGFTNLGRFSQLYRKQVGELPSVTRSKIADQAMQA